MLIGEPNKPREIKGKIAINIVAIFVTIPLYRLLIIAPLIIVFHIHDRHRKPYEHEVLNNVQALSSGCLVLVLLCNIVSSISYMSDYHISGGYRYCNACCGCFRNGAVCHRSAVLSSVEGLESISEYSRWKRKFGRIIDNNLINCINILPKFSVAA